MEFEGFSGVNPNTNENYAMRFLDELRVPFTFKIDGVEFGGLSGVTYNPKTEEHYAIVDRGSRPFAAFHTLDLGVDEEGWVLIDIKKTTTIRVKTSSD